MYRINAEFIQEADMEPKPIRGRKDYRAALGAIKRLWDAPTDPLHRYYA